MSFSWSTVSHRYVISKDKWSPLCFKFKLNILVFLNTCFHFFYYFLFCLIVPAFLKSRSAGWSKLAPVSSEFPVLPQDGAPCMIRLAHLSWSVFHFFFIPLHLLARFHGNNRGKKERRVRETGERQKEIPKNVFCSLTPAECFMLL